MKKTVIYSLVFISTLLIVTLFLANDRNRYYLFSSAGEIRSGQKFGVKIGQKVDDARNALEKNGFKEALDCTDPTTSGCVRLNEIYFLDTGWRSGTVWLVESDASVAAIGWKYQFGAP